MGVRRNVRDPDRVACRPETQRGLRLLRVPVHGGESLPMLAVFAEHRAQLGAHWAGTGPVIVFADKVRERERDLTACNMIEPEEIPRRLPVASALVVLARDKATKRRIAELLDL